MEEPDEVNASRHWRRALADMQRQFDKVVEIGDVTLAEYASAAILDCIIEYKQGTLHLRDAGRKTAMHLTKHFSRVKANDEFLHNEGMNLPLQEEESPLDDDERSSCSS